MEKNPVSRIPASVLVRRLWLSAALLMAAPTLAAAEQVPVTPDGGVYSAPVHLDGELRQVPTWCNQSAEAIKTELSPALSGA